MSEMNQREIDELHEYLKEFTSEVLACASSFREKNTIYASFTYYPEFQHKFLLSYRNENDTVEYVDDNGNVISEDELEYKTTEISMTYGEMVDIVLSQLLEFRKKYYQKQVKTSSFIL